MSAQMESYELIGEGFNVVVAGKVEGVAKSVNTPDQMVKLMGASEELKTLILVTPGGTTTFVAPALIAGIKGVITFAGAPESHLGIISREFKIPVIMSLRLEEGKNIPEGGTVLMDCTSAKIGRVYAKI